MEQNLTCCSQKFAKVQLAAASDAVSPVTSAQQSLLWAHAPSACSVCNNIQKCCASGHWPRHSSRCLQQSHSINVLQCSVPQPSKCRGPPPISTFLVPRTPAPKLSHTFELWVFHHIFYFHVGIEHVEKTSQIKGTVFSTCFITKWK